MTKQTVEIEIKASGAPEAARNLEIVQDQAQEMGDVYADSLGDMERASEDFESSQKKLQQGFQQSSKHFKDFGKTAQSEMSRLDKAFESAKKWFDDFTRISFTSSFKAIATGATIATGALTALAAKGFSEVVGSSRELGITATMLNVTTEEMKSMGEELDQLAIKMGIAPEAMEKAFFKFISVGGDASQAVSVLGENAKLAVGGQMELVTALNFTVNASKAMGWSVEETSKKIADMAIVSANLGDFMAGPFADALLKPLAFAPLLGVSIEQTAAAFTSMVGPMGDVNEVSTITAALFKSLAAPTEQLKKVLKEMGFDSSEAAIATMGLSGALSEIIGTSKQLGFDLPTVIGSAEALRAAMGIGKQRTEEYNQELEKLQNSAGATEKAFSTMTEGIGSTAFAVDQMQAAFTVFTKNLFEAAIGGESATGSIQNLRDLLADPSFAQSIGNLVAGIAKIAQTVVDAATAIGRLKGMQKELSATYQTQAEEARKAFDRTVQALFQVGISYEEVLKKIESSNFAPIIAEQTAAFIDSKVSVNNLTSAVKAGFASQSMLRGEIEKMHAAEAALASTRAEAARSLILQNEQYGISESVAKKAQEALRGMIPVQEKITANTKAATPILEENTKATNAQADAQKKYSDILQESGDLVAYLNETTGSKMKVYTEEAKTLEELAGKIRVLTGVTEEQAESLAAGYVAAQKFTATLSESAELIPEINKHFGDAISIQDEYREKKEKLIVATMTLAKVSREEAEAYAQGVIEQEKSLAIKEKEKGARASIIDLVGRNLKLLQFLRNRFDDQNLVMDESITLITGLAKVMSELYGITKEEAMALAKQVVEMKLAEEQTREYNDAIAENLPLVRYLNATQKAGIGISRADASIKEELTQTVIVLTGKTKEQAEAIVSEYMAYEKLRLTIVEVIGYFDQLVGVLADVAGVSETTASGISHLVSGFGKMVSGDFAGGAIEILVNFRDIGEAVADVCGYITKEIYSMDEALQAASDMLRQFGTATEQSINNLAVLYHALRNSEDATMSLSDAVDDYLQQVYAVHDAMTGATEAVNDFAWSFMNVDLSELNEQLDEMTYALAKLAAIDATAIAEIFSDVDYLSDIFASGTKNIDGWEKKMEIALDTMAMLMKSGMSLQDAIQQMGGTFDSAKKSLEEIIFAAMKGDELEKFKENYKGSVEELLEAAKKLGIEVSDDLASFLTLQDKMAKNEDIMKTIDTLTESLQEMRDVAAFDIQVGNPDDLFNYVDLAMAEYDKLKKAGFSDQEALAAIGPLLAQLKAAAEDAGIVLDEDIQKLIDAGEKAGVLGDTSPLETTEEILTRIADLLAAAFPAAAAKTAAAIGDVNDELTRLGDVDIPAIELPPPIIPPIELPPLEFPMPTILGLPKIPGPPIDDMLAGDIPKKGKVAPVTNNIFIQPGAVVSPIDISGTGLTADQLSEAIKRNQGGIADLIAKAVLQREK